MEALACLLGALLLAGTAPAHADDLFDQANRKFAKQEFAPAAQDYELVLAKNGFSPAALFNLANAYFHDGRVGPAILNYERARLLAPRDPDIVNNLVFVRRQAGLAAPSRNWLERLAGSFSLDFWAGLASGSLCLLCLCLLVQNLLQKRSATLLLFKLLSLSALLLALLFLGTGWSNVRRTAIMTRPAQARISPVATAKAAFPLPEGERVTLERHYNDFVLVRNQSGRTGWVEQNTATPLVPPRL